MKYKVHVFILHDELEQFLNEQAGDGWLLVSMVHTTSRMDSYTVVLAQET